MGDMADFILDQAFYEEGSGLYEYSGTLVCRNCGEDNLHWLPTEDGKWVLVDSEDEMHKCPVRPHPTIGDRYK